MTIKEIAKKAQVSPATVSLVLNGKPGISGSTRDRILDIAAQAGYTVKNHRPQSGMTKGNIQFVKYKADGYLVERNGDFITRIIDGMEDEARLDGYRLGIVNVTAQTLESTLEQLHHEDVDGIVFLGTEFPHQNFHKLMKIRVPLVVVDNQMKNNGVDCVVMDNEAGVALAVRHLYQLGHRKIGHLKSALPTDNFMAREIGFTEIMEELDLEVRREHVVKITPSTDEGCQEMTEYLTYQKKLPTAFFADNDMIAIGAIRALKAAGYRVPEDISVVGFDDLAIGELIDPPLTSVRIFKKIMGESAVKRLIHKIEQKSEDTVKLLVGAKLIARGSAGSLQK